MKHFYLAGAIAGAIVPYVFFIDFFTDEGVGLTTFAEALFVNGAAAGFTADLLITSAVFWVWMLSRVDGPRPWPFILVNLLVGLSCAFPLYLYEQQRRAETVEEAKSQVAPR